MEVWFRWFSFSMGGFLGSSRSFSGVYLGKWSNSPKYFWNGWFNHQLVNGVYGPFGGVWILREYQQIPGCNKNNCMNLTLALRDKLTVRWLEKKTPFWKVYLPWKKDGGNFLWRFVRDYRRVMRHDWTTKKTNNTDQTPNSPQEVWLDF